MKKILPWSCKGCRNEWVGSLFSTWCDCPECGSDAVTHGSARELKETDEWYVSK